MFDKAEHCAISNWGQDPRQLERYPNVNSLCLGVTGYRKTDVTDWGNRLWLIGHADSHFPKQGTARRLHLHYIYGVQPEQRGVKFNKSCGRLSFIPGSSLRYLQIRLQLSLQIKYPCDHKCWAENKQLILVNSDYIYISRENSAHKGSSVTPKSVSVAGCRQHTIFLSLEPHQGWTCWFRSVNCTNANAMGKLPKSHELIQLGALMCSENFVLILVAELTNWPPWCRRKARRWIEMAECSVNFRVMCA